MNKLNEQKKIYLSGYRKHSRRMKRIAAELDEIRCIKKLSVEDNDGGLWARGQRERSLYITRLKDQERELYREGAKEVELHREISIRIQGMQDEDERDVLFYRYMRGMEFFKIAEVMNYSERQIHRIHSRALEHIVIPYDVCQSRQKEPEEEKN